MEKIRLSIKSGYRPLCVECGLEKILDNKGLCHECNPFICVECGLAHLNDEAAVNHYLNEDE